MELKKLSINIAMATGLMIASLGLAQNADAQQSRKERACAIWLCLPVGFSASGCGGARKEFLRRIRKGKSPLPSFSSCSVGSKSAGSYQTGYESHEACPTGFETVDRCDYSRDDFGFFGSNCRPWGRYGGEFRGGVDRRLCVDRSQCSWDTDGGYRCYTIEAPRKKEPYWIEYSFDGQPTKRYYFDMK